MEPEIQTRDPAPGEDNEFNLSFRVLGNEVIGITLSANNVRNKWLFVGLMTTAALAYFIGEYGPTFQSLIK